MTFKSKKIGVICGGFSNERVVSLRSGQNVFDALCRLGYDAVTLDPAVDSTWYQKCDVAFIALHGSYGEDGAIQTLCESFQLPYTGSGPQASILGFNKLLTKLVLKHHQLPYISFDVFHEVLDHLPDSYQFPVIVKPLCEGSSVGVHVIDTDEELSRYTTQLVTQYGAYILEPFIEGQEVTVGVVIDSGQYCEFPILELKPQNRFYDYDAKYTKGKTQFILPAQLSDAVTTKVQRLSCQAFEAIKGDGFGRVDFLVCPKKGPYILEVNTIPGLTDTSDLPAQATHAGWSFDRLIETLLKGAGVGKA